jgi:hypothetical protein
MAPSFDDLLVLYTVAAAAMLLAGIGRCSLMGTRTVNVEPRPGVLCTWMSPPCLRIRL